MMNKEELKLLAMLKDNKISQSDYEMLLVALNKQSFCTQIENSWFINPFQKIAGFKALLLGLLVLLAMSVLGTYSEVYFDGILGFMMPYNLKAMKPNFILLVYQNTAAWLTLSLVFLAMAIFLKQKRIRVIDFFGTVLLARFPILLSLLFTTLHKYLTPDTFKPDDLSKGIELHFSLLNTLAWLVLMGALAWVLMTYLFAFKESSGLDGKRLWFGYITSIVLGDIIAMILTRWFLFV